jgi:hypothetical protein
MKEYYLIFGTEACTAFAEGGFKALEKWASEGFGYELFHWTKTSDVCYLLRQYTGWGEFAVLTKRQYEIMDTLAHL